MFQQGRQHVCIVDLDACIGRHGSDLVVCFGLMHAAVDTTLRLGTSPESSIQTRTITLNHPRE